MCIQVVEVINNFPSQAFSHLNALIPSRYTLCSLSSASSNFYVKKYVADERLATLYLCTVLCYFVFQSEEVCYIEVAIAEVRVRGQFFQKLCADIG